MTRVVTHLSGANQGGAERQLLALIRTAVARQDAEYRHEVILVRDGPLAAEFAALVPTVVLNKKGLIDFAFIRQLRAELKKRRPDIVHSWAPTPNLWAPLVSRSLPGPLAARTVMAEVGLDEWKGKILKFADWLSYRCADLVVGCARAVTEAAIRRGASAARTDTVYLGVEVPAWPDRAPKPGRVQLLGRVDFRKGHQLMLDIWPEIKAAVPEAELVMAGAAVSADELELKASLAAQIAGQPVLTESVQLLDQVNPQEYLAQAAVLVVPSTSEGLPNVVLEAFSHRVPVVATEVGGIPELVNHGQGGWTVPAGDQQAFRDALIIALQNPEQAQQRADAGRQAVAEMTLDRSLAEWETLYDRLLDSSGVMKRRQARAAQR
ncbi:glycosyltransferase [Psychromicrobium lacuslunae]|uniref:Glycosyltransferase subfamily 4-like N-terminal domain-containing protein n=1 Tax=Psychromicrobium lacuslunae TaxID=1618207 RepID=A0A0D4C2I5_9MICC|nr:glycosyltransferase [Psychromicrobium lacuslunae]AJT42561.1 hypothetical protein UM93_15655 [Psychromicrobium lacuslunae]